MPYILAVVKQVDFPPCCFLYLKYALKFFSSKLLSGLFLEACISLIVTYNMLPWWKDIVVLQICQQSLISWHHHGIQIWWISEKLLIVISGKNIWKCQLVHFYSTHCELHNTLPKNIRDLQISKIDFDSMKKTEA